MGQAVPGWTPSKSCQRECGDMILTLSRHSRLECYEQNKKDISRCHHAVMKVFAVHMPESMLALAFILQHVRLKYSNSSQFQATRRELQVFAPSVFLALVFSVGIVINLLCTDK